jgi:hypothetical protein
MHQHFVVPTEASTFYELGSCLSIVAMIDLGERFRYREKRQGKEMGRATRSASNMLWLLRLPL